MPSTTLTRRPQATAFSIEDLLDRVRRGEVRVPEFQRPLKWTVRDVRDLFDSVYRGYPIGTLLFWKREAPAASVHFGPVRIDAPSHSQALWVVDGQQRITAFAGVLLHPGSVEGGPPDSFTLYFDLEAEEFVSPVFTTAPPAQWLPLRTVLDSEQLLDWLDRYPGRSQHPEHTRRAIRLGKSIREYQVPVYIVEAEEEKTLRIIFKRLNTSGKPLKQAEVFNALYGGKAGSHPNNLGDLAEGLKELGFGTLPEQTLLGAVLAVRGLDFTQSFQHHLREEDDLTEALEQTERALRDTIVFLKRDALIPHIQLLPHHLTLHVLARFFHLHPEPSPRSRELLSRWFWRRTVITGDEPLQPGKGKAHLDPIQHDEEQSVQALLAELPFHTDWMDTYWHSSSFDLSEPSARVAMNALLSLQPRHLLTGTPLEPAFLLEDLRNFQLIVPLQAEEHFPVTSSGLLRSPANLLFHPRLSSGTPLEVLRAQRHPESAVLESHGLTPEMLDSLRQGKEPEFLSQRLDFLGGITLGLLAERTRWNESDRPSLQSLIIQDEED